MNTLLLVVQNIANKELKCQFLSVMNDKHDVKLKQDACYDIGSRDGRSSSLSKQLGWVILFSIVKSQKGETSKKGIMGDNRPVLDEIE